jgi:hypothetical protein
MRGIHSSGLHSHAASAARTFQWRPDRDSISLSARRTVCEQDLLKLWLRHEQFSRNLVSFDLNYLRSGGRIGIAHQYRGAVEAIE